MCVAASHISIEICLCGSGINLIRSESQHKIPEPPLLLRMNSAEISAAEFQQAASRTCCPSSTERGGRGRGVRREGAIKDLSRAGKLSLSPMCGFQGTFSSGSTWRKGTSFAETKQKSIRRPPPEEHVASTDRGSTTERPILEIKEICENSAAVICQSPTKMTKPQKKAASRSS